MFKIEEFDIKLETNVLGRNFVYCEEAESSNTILLNNPEYDKEGMVFLVENQTKGKGRAGRSWETLPDQNLTFSVLLKNKFITKKPNLITLAAAVAVAKSLENLYQLTPEVKWPNDILIKKKKICGILCESVSSNNKISKIVVGIGINVNQTNFANRYLIAPTSVKKEIKKIVSRERLLSELLNNLEEIINLLNIDYKKVLDEWRERCKMIGEKVKIVEGNNEIFGIFEDINDDGQLLLRQGDNIVPISFGDVSLR